MAIDYYKGLGIVSAPFIIIDALILRYLFKNVVLEFFHITSKFFLKLKLSANGLFLMALFLVVNDIFGDIVGIIIVIAIFIGLQTARKIKVQRKDLKI